MKKDNADFLQNQSSNNPSSPTPPVGNNMTMDEILSSIRKIISQEEGGNIHTPPAEAIPTANIASDDQLRMLNRNINPAPTPQYVSALQMKKTTQPLPQNVHMSSEARTQNPNIKNVSQRDEILATLNTIRESLCKDYEDPACFDNGQKQINIPSTIASMPHPTTRSTPPKDQNIPSFLRKFRAEQTEKPPSVQKKSQEAPTASQASPPPTAATVKSSNLYDFTDMSKFNDVSQNIMELTEAILPEPDNKQAKTPNKTPSTQKDRKLSDALEMLMVKSMRPLLKEWMDENAGRIAEKMIKYELQKRKIIQ